MRNKKFSGIFGILLSLAMICSLIMIPLTAQAAATWEEVWSEDFDNLTQNQDGTYNLGDLNTTALEIDPATFGQDSYPNTRHAYLTTDTKTGEGYALQLTHTASSTARIPVSLTFDGTSLYKITYDWLTNAANADGKKSRVKFLYDQSYYQVTKSAGKPYLTEYGWGTETEVPQVGEWVQAEIIFNSASKYINIKWIKSNGTVIMNKTGKAWSSFNKINSIELLGEQGGQKIDNIIISKKVAGAEENATLAWSENFDTQPSYGTYTNMEYVTNGSGKALATTWAAWNECLIPIDASVPANAGKGVYKLTYDWYVEQAGTNAASLVRGIIGFEDASNSGYCVGEVASKIGEAFAEASYPVPDTSNSVALLTGRWYKAEVIFDFANSAISYILYDDFDEVVVTAQRAMDALTSLAQLRLTAVECKMRIDNIKLYDITPPGFAAEVTGDDKYNVVEFVNTDQSADNSALADKAVKMFKDKFTVTPSSSIVVNHTTEGSRNITGAIGDYLGIEGIGSVGINAYIGVIFDKSLYDADDFTIVAE